MDALPAIPRQRLDNEGWSREMAATPSRRGFPDLPFPILNGPGAKHLRARGGPRLPAKKPLGSSRPTSRPRLDTWVERA